VFERDFSEAISGQQITGSLGHMATLANESRGDSDAAIAYERICSRGRKRPERSERVTVVSAGG
jgi:hypothetical protein